VNPTERISAARKMFFSGDTVNARRACEVVLLAPANAQEATDARLILVEYSRRAGDPRAGAAHAEAAVAAAPHDALAHYALAVCVEEGGDKPGAIGHLRRAIECNPDLVQAHRYLGALLLDTGDVDAAIASLQRAITLDPDHAEAWNNLGTALHFANRLSDADAAYRRALVLKPDYPRAEVNLAVLQRDQGLPDLAEATLRASIARGPLTVAFRPVLNALADQLRARDELDEAARLYLAAAKLAPDDSAAEMLDLGWCLPSGATSPRRTRPTPMRCA
jgi:Tfp pilus assembly protein PilF